jgi:cation diffusion facilitator CzcD-associated flavoprotein CzcO
VVRPVESRAATPRVAIVGSGFGGLGMAFAMKTRGIDFTLFERSDDVGGTWRDNTYPGCQCDVPSHLYSFSFAPNPDWSRTYSTQPEIQEYLRRFARERELVPHVRLGTDVERAGWDGDARRWRLETNRGTFEAEVLISANGALAEPFIPDLPGLDRFRGTAFHSARWDHAHDLRGRRVAVIGTGSSAVQFVPKIQPLVERLHLFQRTPAWILPHTDRPITGAERALYRRSPLAQRLLRSSIYWSREALVLALARDPGRTRILRALAGAHLRRQVKDPELGAKLIPTFLPGCKRLLLSNDFYPAVASPNVELVTDPIREVTETGVVTADGSERPVDTIIFGTGFRVTDNPAAERIRGADGRTLAEAWRESGPVAYLGTTVAGFPNLFLVTGPNTGIGHTSLVLMIEAQMNYVADAVRTMADGGIAAVDVRPEAQAAFVREVEAGTKGSVWTAGGCRSWYLDPRGRNRTLWPDFTWRFGRRLRRFDPERYRLEPAVQPASLAAARDPASVP